MLSISLPMKGVGHANYYLELARQDYYTAEGNEPGRWFGRGAEALGLRGAVASQPYENLLRGRAPDGRKALVQNAGDPDRQTAWDLTLSAPKSASVLWALGSEEVRAQIEAAHQRAVEAALAFLEETVGLTRRGKAGARFERADLTYATFTHYSSRAHDPQLHTHCLLINMGVRADGTTGALWSKEIFRAKMAAGAVYQVQLAAGLRQELGVVTQPDRIGFQIEGVPKPVCRLFSQRHQVIEAALDKLGVHDAVTAKAVTLDTRPGKVNVRREDLLASWRSRAAALGWGQAQVVSLLHRGQARPCNQWQLERRYREEAEKLPSDKRTLGRLRGLAAAVAVELGADARMFRPLLRHIPGGALGPIERRAGKTAARGKQTSARAADSADRARTDTPTTGVRADAPSEPGPTRTPNSQPASGGPGSERSGAGSTRSEQGEEHRTQSSQADAGGGATADARHQTQANSQRRSRSQKRTGQSGRRHSGKMTGANRDTRQQQRRDRKHWQKTRRRQQAREGAASPEDQRLKNALLLARLDPGHVTTPKERKSLYFAWKEVMESGKADELFRCEPFIDSPRQARRNHQFVRAFEQQLTRMPDTAQTRQALTYHAVKQAVECRANSRALYETLSTMRPAAERGLVSVQWRRLFPEAPGWSPVWRLKAPVIVLGRARDWPRRWDKILWREQYGRVEARVQRRRLFRKAPKWSPVHGWSLPALRLILKPASSAHPVQTTTPSQKANKDQGQSQSH